MGADIREVTPEWVTVSEIAKMRGTSYRSALDWIRRRERWAKRRLLTRRHSRCGGKLAMRTTDLGIIVTEEEGIRPMVPEVAELREELEALTASHARLMRFVAELSKHIGYSSKM